MKEKRKKDILDKIYPTTVCEYINRKITELYEMP